MSATDRATLDTAEFTTALRAAADLIDTDAFDGVQLLDERGHSDQGESLTMYVRSEDAVRNFAARHPGSKIQEHRDEDDGHLIFVRAELGFGRGTSPDSSINTYRSAVTLAVMHLIPEATS
jgi:hypothetical protein